MWKERVRRKAALMAQSVDNTPPRGAERCAEEASVATQNFGIGGASLYPDLSQEMLPRRGTVREVTDEQMKRFFRSNFYDCMKDVEYRTDVVLLNDKIRHSERRYPGCDLTPMLYAYPNRPWREIDKDEPEQLDLMIICQYLYDEIHQALQEWLAYIEKEWAIHESELVIGSETEDIERARDQAEHATVHLMRGAIHPERKVMYMAIKAYARAVAAEMIATCRDDNELPERIQTVLCLAKQEVLLVTRKWLNLQDNRHQPVLDTRQVERNRPDRRTPGRGSGGSVSEEWKSLGVEETPPG